MQAINSTLVHLLEQDYESVHRNTLIEFERVRKIKNINFPDYIIFQTAKRKQYNKKTVGIKTVERKDCPLCEMLSGIMFSEELLVLPDPVPFSSYHFLLRFIADIESKEIPSSPRYVNIKLENHAHRENLIAEDIDLCVSLAHETDYLICQSMRGSGASVPYHIHCHAFKRNAPYSLYLPLLHNSITEFIEEKNGVSLSRTVIPSYGTLLQGNPESFGKRIVNVFENLNIPFNFIAGIGEPFGKAWILSFWRTGDSPSHPIFFDKDTGWWRFGFSEMLGLFEFKSDLQLKSLSKEILDQAMQETCVSDKVLQEKIEYLLLQ